jgi:ElaB/YqjD/DUF883 family membrane-anchored ribosome-binding protein
MDATEHTFPLSEGEQHKLDEVKYEMEFHPAHRVDQFIRRNTWAVLGVAVAVGLGCGLLLGRRG